MSQAQHHGLAAKELSTPANRFVPSYGMDGNILPRKQIVRPRYMHLIFRGLLSRNSLLTEVGDFIMLSSLSLFRYPPYSRCFPFATRHSTRCVPILIYADVNYRVLPYPTSPSSHRNSLNVTFYQPLNNYIHAKCTTAISGVQTS